MSNDIDPRTMNTTQIIFNAMDLDIDLLASRDIAFHREQIDKWLAQWELKCDPNDELMGGNIIRFLAIAEAQTGNEQLTTICKCYRKAQSYYYGMWAKYKIKSKKTPMPEDVKEMLRQKSQPKPTDKSKLELFSIREVEHMHDDELDTYFFQVFGAQTKIHTVDYKRRLLINSMIDAIEAGTKKSNGTDDVPLLLTPTTAGEKLIYKSKPKIAKLTLYQNKALQSQKETAWPWVKKGSWRKDPEKESGTILEIICQSCKTERTIHAGDAFQVKLCTNCKKKSK